MLILKCITNCLYFRSNIFLIFRKICVAPLWFVYQEAGQIDYILLFHSWLPYHTFLVPFLQGRRFYFTKSIVNIFIQYWTKVIPNKRLITFARNILKITIESQQNLIINV